MYKHYLFTRWNLLMEGQSVYNNPKVPDPDEWMEHRMKLFEKYTFPSVLNQTCRNFQWLLSFAKETPDAITDKYRSYPFVKVIYEYPADFVRGLYGKVLNNGDILITSRLDNDDTIEPTYIAKVQEQYLSEFNEDFLLVDTDGRQFDLKTGKYYTVARRSNNSPFISLIEKVGLKYKSLNGTEITDPIKTVYYCSHSKMEWHFPSMKIPERLYTMIIHDRNITNKIVGELL
jgi:hypothetical protein